MRIKDNKDLEYTKNPGGIIALRGEFDIDTRKMFLVGFKRVSKQKLRLDLKTENSEKMAWIRAKNLRGGNSLDFLENKLQDFLNHPYSEIINTDLADLF